MLVIKRVDTVRVCICEAIFLFADEAIYQLDEIAVFGTQNGVFSDFEVPPE